MKYIVLMNEKKEKTILVFPNHIPHRNMTGDTPRQIAHYAHGYPCPQLGQAISAGFVKYTPTGGIHTYGSSESLGLSNHPDDAALLYGELIMDEHAQSIKTPKKER